MESMISLKEVYKVALGPFCLASFFELIQILR